MTHRDQLRASLAMRAAPFFKFENVANEHILSAESASLDMFQIPTAQYVATLVRDYQSLAERAISAVRQEFAELASQKIQIIVSDEAGAHFPRISGSKRARITIPIGFALGLEDIALSCACNSSFLTSAAEYLGPRVRHVRWERAVSQQPDYAAALGKDMVDLTQLSTGFPLNGWRLAQAQLFIDGAFTFAVMHELVHFTMGHLPYATELGFADGLGMSENRAGSTKPDDAHVQAIRQCMELQADADGHDYLATLQGDWQDAHTIASQFNERMAATPDGTLNFLDDLTSQRFFATCCIASILLIEARQFSSASSYPLPAARAYNLLRQTFLYGVFDFGEHSEEEGLVIRWDQSEESLVRMKDGLMGILPHFIFDAGLLAHSLGLKNPLLETATEPLEAAVSSFHDAPVLRDLVSEIEGATEVFDFRTTGARQNAALAPFAEQLRTKCFADRKL